MIVPLPTSASHATSDKEKMSLLAKAFFIAATKLSQDCDDILPQVMFEFVNASCVLIIVSGIGGWRGGST